MSNLGNYELVRLLAHGGMADIYLARPVGTDREVVIKVLNAQYVADRDASELFMDEARIATLLDHPNVASVYDVSPQYLALEYIYGVDLRDIMNRATQLGRTLSYECAIAIVLAAAAGLDHAHKSDVVHRDVSLSNIMVGHDGAVKLIDFGIASSASSVHVTNPGTVRGKPSYMSPEQCLGDPVDQRSDVFSLGIVLYELVTGERCFAGNSDLERMLAVVRGDYVPPSLHYADFPRVLEQVIGKALATDAGARYPSAAAFADALRAVAAIHNWACEPAVIVELMRQLYCPRAADFLDEDTTIGPPPTAMFEERTLDLRRRAA